jgi:hypothetical protein
MLHLCHKEQLNNRTGWQKSNTLDVFSGGVRFESQSGHQLSWLIYSVAFPQSLQITSSVVLRLDYDLTFFQILSNLPVILQSNATKYRRWTLH